MGSRRPYGTAGLVMGAEFPAFHAGLFLRPPSGRRDSSVRTGPRAEQHNGRIHAQLEKSGTPIGGNDLLIAAQELAINGVLVTDNVGELKRVKGLRVENWLRS
jgi:hypothetical protein